MKSLQHLLVAIVTTLIHPNDDVNMGQSSNDVIPTTIAVSSVINVVYELFPALDQLSQMLERKKAEVGDIVKNRSYSPNGCNAGHF